MENCEQQRRAEKGSGGVGLRQPAAGPATAEEATGSQDQHKQGRLQVAQGATEADFVPGMEHRLQPFDEGRRQHDDQDRRSPPGPPGSPSLQQAAKKELFHDRGDQDAREHDQHPLNAPGFGACQPGQGMFLRRRAFQDPVPPNR
jgi:hypothetical protein